MALLPNQVWQYPYNPIADQATPRKLVARKGGWPPGLRMHITDPRVLAVYDLLTSTQGFRYDQMAKSIVDKLDAMALTELHELDQEVTA